jgi:hypothetical protein
VIVAASLKSTPTTGGDWGSFLCERVCGLVWWRSLMCVWVFLCQRALFWLSRASWLLLNVAQVMEDLREECGKYGQVLAVVVPRPTNPATAAASYGANNYGKVWSFRGSLCFSDLGFLPLE